MAVGPGGPFRFSLSTSAQTCIPGSRTRLPAPCRFVIPRLLTALGRSHVSAVLLLQGGLEALDKAVPVEGIQFRFINVNLVEATNRSSHFQSIATSARRRAADRRGRAFTQLEWSRLSVGLGRVLVRPYSSARNYGDSAFNWRACWQ